MDRRQFNSTSVSALGILLLATYQQAYALSLADMSNAQASQGLRAALEKGAQSAVSLLGRPDGFLGNPKVRIPLPGYLENATQLLKIQQYVTGKSLDGLHLMMIGDEEKKIRQDPVGAGSAVIAKVFGALK